MFCCGDTGKNSVTGFSAGATYIIVTPPMETLKQCIGTSDGVSDERRAGNYYRIVDGDRLLWGGDITAFGELHPQHIARKMS